MVAIWPRNPASRQYKHPSRPGRVTVPAKPSDDLAPGTLGSILKQSGLRK
ncbi:MAG: addiction module toxin, HicA family [Chromatiales bacterium]|nr:MAG: addiction module toxin, HicA family [Chromatiales bacterium]